MRKKGMVISLFVAIALLASGCTIQFNSNGWIYQDTDGNGNADYGFREHSFIKPAELNGTYIYHLNMDEKILDADGKVVTVNHTNVQTHMAPPSLNTESELYAMGYGFSDESVLWIAIVTTIVDRSGDVEVILDMNGNEAHTLYDNILNIVALGAKYEDGTECWADAQFQ
jgi:hypothetical protein